MCSASEFVVPLWSRLNADYLIIQNVHTTCNQLPFRTPTFHSSNCSLLKPFTMTRASVRLSFAITLSFMFVDSNSAVRCSKTTGSISGHRESSVLAASTKVFTTVDSMLEVSVASCPFEILARFSADEDVGGKSAGRFEVEEGRVGSTSIWF